ncbi:MAG: 3-hydroxyacyl-CoA dehydrogenase [Thermodesulfobacteriota bacterium]
MEIVKADQIKKVLVLGAGTMGQQIGFLCASNGFDTTIYDLSRDLLDTAKKRMEKLSRQFVARHRITEPEAIASLNRITLTTEASLAAENADFVSESVTESVEIKCRVFETFHPLCPGRAVFTTNTSSLIPSMLTHAVGRPKQFAAFHFHNTLTTDIVDIMPHPETAKETVDTIHAFALRLGQTPILFKKENHGYAFNALLMNLCDTALYLAAGGVASVEDIDRSWMGIMHMKIGPFGIMDSIGLDTVLKVNEVWADQLNDPRALTNVEFLKRYIKDGKRGEKTGEGFYKYPDPAYRRQNFIRRT